MRVSQPLLGGGSRSVCSLSLSPARQASLVSLLRLRSLAAAAALSVTLYALISLLYEPRCQDCDIRVDGTRRNEGRLRIPNMDPRAGEARGPQPFKRRLLHLDMKGAPPRVAHLRRLMPVFADLGVTGILIEWEDTFPYDEELAVLRAPYAYSKKDVREIVVSANASGLEVIPLVQTFGHLEFVLKQPAFATLRERPSEDSSICPSKNASRALITSMIQQIYALHPESLRIHIGADEAYYVGEDEDCRKMMEEQMENRQPTQLDDGIERLKLDHIARTARTAREIGFTEVLVWNDMFGEAAVDLIREAGLGRLVTPVVWGYAVDVTRDGYFPPGLFERLSQVFPRIWFASAFKGANGQSNPFLSIERYLANQQSYVTLYRLFEKELSGKMEGMIVTGWSRFSHHKPLCELLPVGLPSAAVCLAFLADVSATPKKTTALAKSLLNCPSSPSASIHKPRQFLTEIFYPSKEQLFTECAFPGSDIFTMVQELRFLAWKSHRALLAPEYHEEVNREVNEIEEKLRPALSSIFFNETVNEFIDYHVRSLYLRNVTTQTSSTWQTW